MSAVFRTVTLAWDGKTYEVKPTMELLNRIENRVSLAALVRGLSTDAPPISHMAFVLASSCGKLAHVLTMPRSTANS